MCVLHRDQWVTEEITSASPRGADPFPVCDDRGWESHDTTYPGKGWH